MLSWVVGLWGAFVLAWGGKVSSVLRFLGCLRSVALVLKVGLLVALCVWFSF